MEEVPMPRCMRVTGIRAPLHRKGYVHSNTYRRSVGILPDSGAQILLASQELIQDLTIPTVPLERPLRVGSVNDPDAMIVTHKAKINYIMGNTEYCSVFHVAPMRGEPELILGTPWFEEHCPHILRELENLGENPTNHMVSGGGEIATRKHAAAA